MGVDSLEILNIDLVLKGLYLSVFLYGDSDTSDIRGFKGELVYYFWKVLASIFEISCVLVFFNTLF